MLSLCRFFLVVTPVPRLMHATLAAAGAAGAVAIAIDAGRAPRALTPVLLLQLFAASSGFMVPARRGHFDLVLSIGQGRRRVACAHWLLSVAPGCLAWLVLALTEAIAGDGPVVLASSGTAAAVLLVSTIPWAVTVALPRFAGAIGWLVVLTVFAMVPSAPAVFDGIGGGPSWLHAAAGVALYPQLLAGEDIRGAAGLLAAPALIGAVVSLAYAFVWIDRRDIPLEAAQ